MTTEPKTASTWEECALHVEAGGVVQVRLQGGHVWLDESLSADAYRGLRKAPGEHGYRSRRLLPIKDATPAGMTPGPEVDGRPTWYGSAEDAEAAGMTEARGWTHDRWSSVDRWGEASIVQARYPLPPKHKTVRVHWWEAVGRTDPNDGEIVKAQKVAGRKPQVRFAGVGYMVDVTSPDGTVEVLAKDDES